MPDEHSNLNMPAPRRTTSNNTRRRGRRGGRGRSPRRDAPKGAAPGPEEISPAAETADVSAAPAEAIEPPPQEEGEAENQGGFRTPHAEPPEEFASHETDAPEPVGETSAPPEPEPPPRHERGRERERQPEPPPRRKEWIRPRDFRPAAPSAIAAAVEHATFIAEQLKELHDQMDEILELVEVAERQKIADERELEDLRRALRRSQPSRPPPQQFQRPQPRREEPRRQPLERRDPPPQSETPPTEENPEPPSNAA